MEFKAQKISVPEGNPFENDKLGIEKHVTNLSLLLKNISSPLVLSINAPWGYGKTTFLEMLSADLKNSGCKTISFNAWETDFANDPLVAFLGEMNPALNALGESNTKKSEILEEVKKSVEYIVKKVVPLLINIGTASTIGSDLSKFTEGLAKDLIDNYSKEKQEIDKFKENLKNLLNNEEGDNSKIYIFVDELDRCRPTYAINLLERIKHLLDIEGLVFILAMDKLQLSHSIKGVYGNEFEAIGYLRRFIDIEYTLPKSNLDEFVKHLYQTFNFNHFFDKRKRYENLRYDSDNLSNVLKLLLLYKKLSLREIEQLFSKINLVLHSTKENEYLHPTLLTFLLIAKEFHADVYNEYIKESSTPESMISLLYEIIPENVRYDSKECTIIEAFLISANNNHYQSSIGKSLETHKKIAEHEKDNHKRQLYSIHVIQFCKHIADNFRYVSLDTIVSHIDMLENFNFGAVES